jgi:hypothetical protein
MLQNGPVFVRSFAVVVPSPMHNMLFLLCFVVFCLFVCFACCARDGCSFTRGFSYSLHTLNPHQPQRHDTHHVHLQGKQRALVEQPIYELRLHVT